MSDLFRDFSAKPMLIGAEEGPFNDPDFIFELKLDGERCIAYLDGSFVELRNKRNNRLVPKFPELSGIGKQLKKRCILDGELTVQVDGKPSFSALLSRIMRSGHGFKSELAATRLPAGFTAFDILYCGDRDVTQLPLLQRKELLDKIVAEESSHFAVSRFIEREGERLFRLTCQQQLEGIVAKRAESIYRMGTRTKDWIKIKNMQDDDFVICGWIQKRGGVNSIVLGKYIGRNMVYKGHVTLAVSGADFREIQKVPRCDCPFFPVPKGNGTAIWIQPKLVCSVKYMNKTASGGLRQPVYKGLRPDKRPEECTESI